MSDHAFLQLELQPECCNGSLHFMKVLLQVWQPVVWKPLTTVIQVPDYFCLFTSRSIWVTLIFFCSPISISNESRNLMNRFLCTGCSWAVWATTVSTMWAALLLWSKGLELLSISILWCTSNQGFWGIYCAICNPVWYITAHCAFVGAAEWWGLLFGLFHCKGGGLLVM